jgi:hypothetical protein
VNVYKDSIVFQGLQKILNIIMSAIKVSFAKEEWVSQLRIEILVLRHITALLVLEKLLFKGPLVIIQHLNMILFQPDAHSGQGMMEQIQRTTSSNA